MARSTCSKCGNQRFELVENEPDNVSLREFYSGLLRMTAAPAFQEGGFIALASDNPYLVSYARTHRQAITLVIVKRNAETAEATTA